MHTCPGKHKRYCHLTVAGFLINIIVIYLSLAHWLINGLCLSSEKSMYHTLFHTYNYTYTAYSLPVFVVLSEAKFEGMHPFLASAVYVSMHIHVIKPAWLQVWQSIWGGEVTLLLEFLPVQTHEICWLVVRYYFLPATVERLKQYVATADISG